jgi:antitoxin VapB
LSHSAKLYSGDDGQIVYLPAEFRFNSTEVFIRKDLETGEVILSEKSESWDDFFAARDAAIAAGEIPDDFIDLEARKREVQDRDSFSGLKHWPATKS